MAGHKLKSLIDAVGHDNSGARGFLDYKTTTDCRERHFAKRAFDLHYDMQLEFYAAALARLESLDVRPWCLWIVQETTAPYEVQVYCPTERMVASGAAKLEKALRLLTICSEENQWPGYGSGIKDIDPPRWAEFEGDAIV